MGLFSTVDCAEENGTAKTNYDESTGKTTASVVLRTSYANGEALKDDILGNRRQWPHTTTTVAPVALRATIASPGANVHFTSVPADQICIPDEVLVSVEYGIPEFEPSKPEAVGEFDFVTESIEPAAEFQTLDFNQFRWGSSSGDPIKKDEAPGKLNVKVMLVRRISQLPTPLSALILSAIGKCNLAAYTSPLLGITFAAETLLYLEPGIERTVGSGGTTTVNYTQKWCWNPNGWNKYWRAETETWEYMYNTDRVTGGSPYKSYVPIDLSALLL